MSRVGKSAVKGHVIALALTWDGARWPVRALPPKARAFLSGSPRIESVPAAEKLSRLFADDRIAEIRICWVPRLKGGNGVLSGPFQTATGLRLAFRSDRTVRLGDVLGVVYRRGR